MRVKFMRQTVATSLVAGVVGLLLLLVLGPGPNPARDLERALSAQGLSSANPYAYWVPPGNCNSTVSGNSTGTQGLTTTGASTTPVVAAQTSASGTNTHTYICNITPPYYIVTANLGFAIQDVVFFYSPESNLGTQVANLANGTLNAATVFGMITYPTPAAGETQSTVAPIRADAGTLVIAPTVGTFNVSTVTAGQFFSARFTPATPIAWRTDLQQLLLTVTLQLPVTTAVRTTTPGVLVHFRSQ